MSKPRGMVMNYKAGDVIPGLLRVPQEVREVQKGVCCLCGREGYVLAGLRLDLSVPCERSFYQKYQAQKPVLCQNSSCGLIYCQKCVKETYSGFCGKCGGRVQYL